MVDNKLTLNTSKSCASVITPKLRCASVSLDLLCPAGIVKTDLGITMDNQLNIGEHIKNIENKVARAVGILSKLNYFLPYSAKLQLYYSLVHPHILYGVAIWGNTFSTYLANLSRPQNKAIRLVTVSDWKTSVAPLYRATNVLPLSDIIKFETAKIVYCHYKKCLPSSFDHYFNLAKNSHS